MISKVPLSLAFMLGAAISYPVSSGQLLAREEKEEKGREEKGTDLFRGIRGCVLALERKGARLD
jgi:hypothetical protein